MRPGTAADRAVDTAVVAFTTGLACLGFATVYGGSRWVVAAAGGTALGLAAAWLGAARRLPAVVVAAAAVLGVLLLGPLLALPGQPVPTPAALGALLDGAVGGWRDVLTLVPPVAARGALLVPALLAPLLAAVLAGSFALRLRRTWPALVPPAALLAGVAMLGTDQAVQPVLQGVLLLVVGLAWTGWRSRRDAASAQTGTSTAARSRLVAGAAVVAVAAAVAGAAAPSLAAPEQPRYSLRERVQPPLDPRTYPSPLAGFRKYVKDLPDEVLFTVDGLPEGARVRLATLDSYDGVVWQVSPPDAGTGRYLRVGPETGDRAVGSTAQVDVTVGEYAGVWLPTVGQTTRVDFAGTRTTELSDTFHYNASTGTALTTRGLRAGDRYSLDVVVPPTLDDAAVGAAEAASVSQPEPQQVPGAVGEVAGELAADANTPVERARALQAGLAQGFFSHGLDGGVPSRAGHGADRVAELLAADQMVGDHEQYAATMALMARRLGLPARVVMGFVPTSSGTVEVTGDDVSAWVEVAFAGQGWMVFDPTPDESRVPQQQAPKPRSQPRPQVPQPPPPVEEPAEPPSSSGEEVEPLEADEPGAAGRLLAVLAWTSLPLLLVLGPVALLVGLKLRRRRRRARLGTPAARIAGGWAEVVDAARDLGTRPPSGATRRETAQALQRSYESAGTVALAERADAGVFAPGEPTEDEVARFWADVEQSLKGMSSSVSRWRRLRGWLSPRSLRARG